jgi:hypothetical protein
MSINDLFSTPDQGRRLKELVPELTSAFVWMEWKDHTPFIHDVEGSERMNEGLFALDPATLSPALTLQELRDVARNTVSESWASTFFEHLWDMTAPELAAWVIERLEATP